MELDQDIILDREEVYLPGDSRAGTTVVYCADTREVVTTTWSLIKQSKRVGSPEYLENRSESRTPVPEWIQTEEQLRSHLRGDHPMRYAYLGQIEEKKDQLAEVRDRSYRIRRLLEDAEAELAELTQWVADMEKMPDRAAGEWVVPQYQQAHQELEYAVKRTWDQMHRFLQEEMSLLDEKWEEAKQELGMIYDRYRGLL